MNKIAIYNLQDVTCSKRPPNRGMCQSLICCMGKPDLSIYIEIEGETLRLTAPNVQERDDWIAAMTDINIEKEDVETNLSKSNTESRCDLPISNNDDSLTSHAHFVQDVNEETVQDVNKETVKEVNEKTVQDIKEETVQGNEETELTNNTDTNQKELLGTRGLVL